MVRIAVSLCCAALSLVLVSGCPAEKKSPGAPKGGTPEVASKGGDTADLLVIETEEIELLPGAEKDVKVKAGKAQSADAPKDAGLTAKVHDGKVTVSAGDDAKAGTHEVKIKGAKNEATLKVNVKKAEKK
jgi:hypothetical protein